MYNPLLAMHILDVVVSCAKRYYFVVF